MRSEDEGRMGLARVGLGLEVVLGLLLLALIVGFLDFVNSFGLPSSSRDGSLNKQALHEAFSCYAMTPMRVA
jgi:hypothetical protein